MSLGGTRWRGQEWFAQNYLCTPQPELSHSPCGWRCRVPWPLGYTGSIAILPVPANPCNLLSPSKPGQYLDNMSSCGQTLPKCEIDFIRHFQHGWRTVWLLGMQARRCAGRHAQRHPTAWGHPLGQKPPGDLRWGGTCPLPMARRCLQSHHSPGHCRT